MLGSGPGGYSAAFRAADLGHEVTLVERYEQLGGVCLNVGCIPSKALLHTAALITEAEVSAEHGVAFGAPQIDLDALRSWKDSVVGKLTGGLAQMAKVRKVTVVRGEARFTSATALDVDGTAVAFDSCIVAAGSRSIELPGIPHDDPRVMTSTGALELRDIPERLLVVGGGIIGLELGTVYDALGSAVTVVELTDQLIPGCDKDLVKPLAKRMGGRWEAIHLGAKVTAVEAREDGLHATFERRAGAGRLRPRARRRRAAAQRRRDRRRQPRASPSTSAGSSPSTRSCARACRTSSPSATSIGGPMLAHKAIARRPRRRRGHRRARRQLRAARDPVGRLHRPGDRVGRG